MMVLLLTGLFVFTWSSGFIVAKAIVLLAIVVLIRFKPQGMFSARVRA